MAGSFWLLVDIDGRRSLSVPLPESALVVGRGAECGLVLTGGHVSRQHVLLERAGDDVRFSDLGSTIGTLLNGVRQAEGQVRPGDRITVGAHTLLLVDRLPERGACTAAAAAAGAAPPADWRPFGMFFERLRGASGAKELFGELLQGLMRLYGVERGFVLRASAHDAPPTLVAARGFTLSEASAPVSLTVYREACRRGCPLLVPDTWQDPAFSETMSVKTDRPRLVICAPLVADSGPVGAIYLDAPAEWAVGEDKHLPAIGMVASFAAELLVAGAAREELTTTQARLGALVGCVEREPILLHGDGAASQELHRLLDAVAARDVNVLITGETGTGKEMVARRLHFLSTRRRGPFVALDCAALPPDVLDAELLGAERGAYTGATERRVGRLEQATGGSLFLDEVGNMPAEAQLKLLRVLEDRSLMRLGGTEPVPLDFRLICATNADLEEEVRRGSLRRDFLFRIDVVRFHLDPLRRRREDIEPLALHFLREFAARFRRRIGGIAPDALRLLREHPWPGNVRELRNCIERAVLLEEGDTLTGGVLPIAPHEAVPEAIRHDEQVFWEALPDDHAQAVLAFERLFIERMLARHGGNLTAVARATGMTRPALYRRLLRTGLDRKG